MIRQMNTDRLSQYIMMDVVEAARLENRIAAQRATAEAVAVAAEADAAEGQADEEIEAEEIEERINEDLPLVINA
jgi:RNA processing factor Prp31